MSNQQFDNLALANVLLTFQSQVILNLPNSEVKPQKFEKPHFNHKKHENFNKHVPKTRIRPIHQPNNFKK